MALLLSSTRNPATSRVNIGSWLQVSNTNCILQALLDVKGTVFSTTTATSRWCQHTYSLTQVYATFVQIMQLFISSSFDKKKLQGLKMLLYSLFLVIICNFSIFVCKCAVYNMFLSTFIQSKYSFQTITQLFYIAISHISIKQPTAEGRRGGSERKRTTGREHALENIHRRIKYPQAYKLSARAGLRKIFEFFFRKNLSAENEPFHILIQWDEL